MTDTREITVYTRRDAVKVMVVGGLGLMVGCKTRSVDSSVRSDVGSREESGLQLHKLIFIDDTGRVKFFCTRAEMGQGIAPTFALIIAEELEIDPSAIVCEFAGTKVGPEGGEFTGGSSSMSEGFSELRSISATAAALLLAAGAKSLGTTTQECYLQDGKVWKKNSQESVPFGDIAAAASKINLSGSVRPKPLNNCRFIGKDTPLNLRKVDGLAKVTGKAVFGIDVQLENMLCAYILRNPFISGKLKSCDLAPAQNMPGVRKVFKLPQDAPVEGICVIAEFWYQAQAAASTLNPLWEKDGNIQWETVRTQRKQILDGQNIAAALPEMAPSDNVVRRPNEPENEPALALTETAVQNAAASAGSNGSAAVGPVDYEVPYVPHAPMEPMNAVAWVHENGSVEVWAPSQGVSGGEKVHRTFMGGGFGRRLASDYVDEAVAVAKASGLRVPIKLIWTRRDDFAFDYFRPGSQNRLQGKVANGRITQWSHHMVGASINHHDYGFANKPQKSASADTTGQKPPYNIPSAGLSLRSTGYEAALRTGYWRAIGHSQNSWLVECFIDELATASGADPLAFRLANLRDKEIKKALQELATLCPWSQRSELPTQTGLGIAVSKGWSAGVAAAAQVQVQGGMIYVQKMWFVIGGGLTVNPAIARQQVESAVMFGLSATLKQQITIKDHKIQETSFERNQPIRMDEAPLVEVRFIKIHDNIHGMGETALPCVAPAVCNAIFAATKKRVRSLPATL